MHAQNLNQPDPNNPYIQIMFNINSKKVVNNNILPDQNQLHINLPNSSKNQFDKPLIFPQKKSNTQTKIKSHKQNNNKSIHQTSKPQDIPSQDNIKNKKKISNKNKSNNTGSQTQRSARNSIYKKNTSQGFSKLNSSQQCILSTSKPLTKSKTKLKNQQKDTRQKIIQLIIKDYQKGTITMDNLKKVISSLIQKQTQQKSQQNKLNIIKSQFKNDKTRIKTSYKNSLAASLHNTPRHKPLKSKSQKYHHSYQQSYRIKQRQQKYQKQSPQIVQRIIDRKQFVNKIVIKGINSSLFLSNQFTDKESPQKNQQIHINAINTSDSVKDLRKQMNKTLKLKRIYVNQDLQKINKNNKREQIKQIKRESRHKDTTSILQNIIKQLKNEQNNQLLYSAFINKSNINQQQSSSLRYIASQLQGQTIIKTNKNQNNNKVEQSNNDQQNDDNELDNFYIRQDQTIFSNQKLKYQQQKNQYKNNIRSDKNKNNIKSDKQLVIQQLQKQYSLLLKQKSSTILNEEKSNENYKIKQYNYNQNQQSENIYNEENIQNSEQCKLKTYLSSQLQNKLSNLNSFSANKQQQLNNKRNQSITNTQIKKLNNILNLIKQQIHNNQASSPKKNQQVLNKIVQLLQSQRKKVQQQLKIYDHPSDTSVNNNNLQISNKLQNSIKLDSSINNNQNNQLLTDNKTNNKHNQNINKDLTDNQIINSFKKKLNKNNILSTLEQNNNQFHQYYNSYNNSQKIYYQSNDLQSISSSKSKSLKSHNSSLLSSSNHLQKIKISQLNFDQIQIGLRKRLNDLQIKRQQQYEVITQKFINDRITAKQYQEQKQIIQKWFNLQFKQLKQTQINLIKGYKKAKQLLLNDKQYLLNDDYFYETKLSKQKSYKMIKSISQKYLTKINPISQNKQFQNKKKQNQNKIQGKQQKQTNEQRYINKVNNKNKKNKITQKQTKQQNKSYKPVQIINNKKYQTIQQFEDQLIRNITPIQKFNFTQKDQKSLDALSPLSIQQSQQNELNRYNQNETNQLLMNINKIQQNIKANQSIQSKIQQLNKIIGYNETKTQYKQQEQQKTQNQKYQKQYQKQQNGIQNDKIKPKRPQSSYKIHKQIQSHINHYNNQNKQIQNNQNQIQNQTLNNNSTVINQLSKIQEISLSNIQSLQQNLNKQSSDQQYYGSNEESSQQQQIQEESINQQQQQQQSNNQEVSPEQQSLNSSKGLLLQQSNQLNIIVNKKLLNQQEQLFSPIKPSIYQQFSQQLQQYNSIDTPQYHKTSLQFTQLNKQFNQNYIKLKYLTDQDKDDIFQFMFLDLCLQIFLEQTKNNKIMKSIEKHLIYMRRKRKIPKGFKTNLQTCRNYITQMQKYLLSTNIQILKRLQSQMGPSAKQMLKFMRDYQDLSQSSEQIQTVNLILPIQIYQKFQLQPVNKLQVERYYDDEQKQQSRLRFLKSLKHYHNKAIFDSLNQMLDLERSYGIWGKPFPWKKSLSIQRSFNQQQIKKKLKQSSQKVIQNCSYLCGVLVDKEDSVFGKSHISQQYLTHIRQDRMSKMLSNDMIDNQDRWIFYDDQETQVLVSISKTITNQLLHQFLQQITFIHWKVI